MQKSNPGIRLVKAFFSKRADEHMKADEKRIKKVKILWRFIEQSGNVKYQRMDVGIVERKMEKISRFSDVTTENESVVQ